MGEATYAQQRRIRDWRKPDGAKSCVRPGMFGNVFAVGGDLPDGTVVRDAEHAVELFRDYLIGDDALLAMIPRLLAGRVLMCWCAPGAPCHVQDVLIPVANGQPIDQLILRRSD